MVRGRNVYFSSLVVCYGQMYRCGVVLFFQPTAVAVKEV